MSVAPIPITRQRAQRGQVQRGSHTVGLQLIEVYDDAGDLLSRVTMSKAKLPLNSYLLASNRWPQRRAFRRVKTCSRGQKWNRSRQADCTVQKQEIETEEWMLNELLSVGCGEVL